MSPLFNPTPAQQSDLLAAISSGDHSLISLAKTLNTSVEALTLFISVGPFAQRIATIAAANATFIRLAAAFRLPDALSLLNTVATTLHTQIKTAPVDLNDPQSLERSRHRMESARRAATTIIRLSRFTAEPPRHRSDALGAPVLSGTASGGTAVPAVLSAPAPSNLKSQISNPQSSSPAPDFPAVADPASADPALGGTAVPAVLSASAPPDLKSQISNPSAPANPEASYRPRSSPRIQVTPNPRSPSASHRKALPTPDADPIADPTTNQDLLDLAHQLDAFASLIESQLPQPAS